jgi:hypothetical protein
MGGQEAWKISLSGQFKKPIVAWSGRSLIVRYTINVTPVWRIDETRARAQVDGSALQLCYFTIHNKPIIKQTIAKDGTVVTETSSLMALWPETLEFTVTGIPVHDYTIKVLRDCMQGQRFP